jgi:RNA polymerase sigma-B factor
MLHSHTHRSDFELVAGYRDGGDAACREELVLRHSGLVRGIARRYHGRVLAREDIEQTGYVGLIHAVDRFDPSRGVPLGAFAARTIEGEIMHLFRDRGWAVRVPRSLQERSRRVASVRDGLGHRLGRSPSLRELAEAIGETEQRVAEAVAAGRAHTAEPLEDAGTFEEAGFARVDDRDLLEHAIRALPARERRIVGLRVYHDLSQCEIAERTGISQMHVSRLLRAALRTLEHEIDWAAA